MSTTTPPEAPPAEERPSRSFSGKTLVVAAVLFAVAFVAFLLFVSPLLLERTLSSAPPGAPHEVAAGEVDGVAWTATAVEQASDQPCLEVRAASAAWLLCTEPRGLSLRGVEAASVAGTPVLHGIVDARTTVVRLGFEGTAAVEVEPTYVDFGFPLGFFAVEAPAGGSLTEVTALDRDGEPRGRARCTTGAGRPSCVVVPLD